MYWCQCSGSIAAPFKTSMMSSPARNCHEKKNLKTWHSSNVQEGILCVRIVPCCPHYITFVHWLTTVECRPLGSWKELPSRKWTYHIIFLISINRSYNGGSGSSLLLRILKCYCLFPWVLLIFPTSTILMLERSYLCIIFPETGGWRTYDPFQVKIKTSV